MLSLRLSWYVYAVCTYSCRFIELWRWGLRKRGGKLLAVAPQWGQTDWRADVLKFTSPWLCSQLSVRWVFAPARPLQSNSTSSAQSSLTTISHTLSPLYFAIKLSGTSFWPLQKGLKCLRGKGECRDRHLHDGSQGGGKVKELRAPLFTCGSQILTAN